MFNNSADVVVIYDIMPVSDGVYEPTYNFINTTCASLLGLEASAVVGKTNTALLGAEAAADLDRFVLDAHAGRDRPVRVEHELKLPTGPRTFDTVYSCLWPAEDEGGYPCVLGLCRDVTLRIETERALTLAKETAEESSRLKSVFVTSISHDLRTPLAGIVNIADLLSSRREMSAEDCKLVDILVGCSRTLLHLCNDITDLGKVESNSLVLEPRPCNPADLCWNAVELVRASAEAKSLRLGIELADNLPRCVLVDGVRVEQILHNLLSNAVKFTDHGEVALSAEIQWRGRREGAATTTVGSGTASAAAIRQHERDGVLLTVRVRDTGIGIKEEAFGSIFKPFIQDTTDKTREQRAQQTQAGCGLGLNISQGLAKLMGGEVRVESVRHQGSTFTLVIPVPLEKEPRVPGRDQQQAGAGPGASTSPPAGGGGPPDDVVGHAPHVLLVEDNDVSRTVMKKLLLGLGCTVVDTAITGLEALEAMRKAPPNYYGVVLMDWNMPIMDGLNAIRHIKEEFPNPERRPAIYMLTAAAMVGDRKRCLEGGADHYLTKPVTRARLREVLLQHVDEGTDGHHHGPPEPKRRRKNSQP